jgi:hypothetical protein
MCNFDDETILPISKAENLNRQKLISQVENMRDKRMEVDNKIQFHKRHIERLEKSRFIIEQNRNRCYMEHQEVFNKYAEGCDFNRRLVYAIRYTGDWKYFHTIEVIKEHPLFDTPKYEKYVDTN